MAEEITYKISRHAKERYAERIMGKDDKNDVQRFIVENEDKITNDITKMLQYGELIYQGKSNYQERKGQNLNVYLKGTWLILVGPKTNNVITLYKVDLKCGDDFNEEYISKMLEQINIANRNLEETKRKVEEEAAMYKELICEATVQINEYKAMIKNLENLCEGYKMIMDNNIVKNTQAYKDVTEVINTLLSKKEF